MQSSVHLESYPDFSNSSLDLNLVQDMAKVRDICSLALSIRKSENIKVRTPLSELNLYGKNLAFIQKYSYLITDEINVKSINIREDISEIGKEVLQVNFKTLGPKVGKDIQKIIAAQKLQEYKKINDSQIEIAGIIVKNEDFNIVFQAKDGVIAKFSNIADCGLSLNLNLTEDLIQEGEMRDFIRFIQQERKVKNLNVSDRIDLEVYTTQKFVNIINKFIDNIKFQCLINNIIFKENDFNGVECVNEEKIKILIK